MQTKKKPSPLVVICILVLTLLATIAESWHNISRGRWIVGFLFALNWVISAYGWGNYIGSKRLSARQARVQIRVNKDRNLDNDLPNPKHTGVLIRGLLDHREAVFETLYEDTLAGLLDTVVTQTDFELLTTEEIGILKQWNSGHQRLSHSRTEFLTRFDLL